MQKDLQPLNQPLSKGSFKITLKKNITQVIFWALIVRVLFLAILYLVNSLADIRPYIITDDQTYDRYANDYLKSATSLFDVGAFNRMGANRIKENFWVWVVSVVTYLFKSVVFVRILNIILSVASVGLIYKLTNHISNDEKTALRAAKLFAFLPYPLIICCFPIKDIFILFVVLLFIETFFEYIKTLKFRLIKIFILGILLYCVYRTRGAIVEMLLLMCIVYMLLALIRKKKYMTTVIFLVIVVVAAVYFWDDIMKAFVRKVTDYSAIGARRTAVDIVKIKSLADIYKLPATYIFAMLQPMKTRLFTISNGLWEELLMYLNLSLYPIAIGNFIFALRKNKNWLYWITTTSVYIAIIIISLGAFRHYLCVIPYHIINYSLLMKDKKVNTTQYIFIASFSLFFLFFAYSIYVL